jgi:CheY-like chemotaxis protein/anti-sigma regulatory factor (Ser/Thr protein kinase)
VEGHWDRVRVGQVVGNLVSNAIKYGAGKPVSVTATTEAAQARIQVADRGIGIPLEEHARIFERFGRATSAHSAQSHGLGLWIVRRLIRAMNGQVELESAPGEGSTFTVTLPREISSAPMALAPGDDPKGGAAPKVLIVDDDEDLVAILVQLLEHEGFRVDTAPNGAHAMRAMRTGDPPDLILLDIVMPVLDGKAVYQAMRADPALASIPVVVTTADPLRAPLGVITLRKPTDSEDLLGLVHRLTRGRPG